MPQERLQKFLSAAGVASRRAAEKLIIGGKVKVNGRVVLELGTKVDHNKDKVEVGGRPVKPRAEYLYLVMYKPEGVVTTRKDEFKRQTVYDLLPQDLRQKVWTIGRLDADSAGLLLFTNDGELTQKLSHPSFENDKEYEVVLDKPLRELDKKRFEEGIVVDKQKTYPAKIKVVEPKLVRISIHEGRNRQVRKMFGGLNYTVRRLTRVREGKLRLEKLDLKPKQIKKLTRDDII